MLLIRLLLAWFWRWWHFAALHGDLFCVGLRQLSGSWHRNKKTVPVAVAVFWKVPHRSALASIVTLKILLKNGALVMKRV